MSLETFLVRRRVCPQLYLRNALMKLNNADVQKRFILNVERLYIVNKGFDLQLQKLESAVSLWESLKIYNA